MFIFISSILILFIVNGYVLLEEETLIILASFIWLDAAGGMFKSFIHSELEHKAVVIKNQYLFYLNLRKDTLCKLIDLHKTRKEFTFSYVKSLQDYIIVELLNKSLKSTESNLGIAKNYEQKLFLVDLGLKVVYDNILNSLNNILSIDLANYKYFNSLENNKVLTGELENLVPIVVK